MAKLNLQSGENSSMVIKKRTVRGLSVRLVGVHATAATATANTDFDLSKVRIKATLERGKAQYVLCNERLDILAMDSAFDTADFDFVAVGSTTRIIFLAQTAGVKEVAMIPAEVDFGGHINLRKDDEITVEVFPSAGVFGANLDQTNSRVEVDWKESVGIEQYVPLIRTQFLKPAESDVELSLGDNVATCRIINTDKTAVLEAQAVIDNVSVSTDRFSMTTDYRDLMQKRIKLYPNVVDAQKRLQSFELLEGSDFDNVNIKLKTIAGNVAASKTCIVYRTLYVDRTIAELADVTQRGHAVKRMRKIGIGIDDNEASLRKAQLITEFR